VVSTQRPVPLVVGNWKMNTTVSEGVALARALRAELDGSRVDVALLPPLTHLVSIRAALEGSRLRLGAQNCSAEESGAYTGEVSAAMLTGLCDDVILGHSERRYRFGESDEVIARKLRAAQRHGLRALLAVGETEEERVQGATMTAVDRQMRSALEGLDEVDGSELVLVYEPVWAVNTGHTATPAQADEVCGHIEGRLGELLGRVLIPISVLYGGSMTPENASGLFSQPHIDGAVVGAASLTVGSFVSIVHSAEACSSDGEALL